MIYTKFRLPHDITVEEVYEDEETTLSDKVWQQMAYQIINENGKDGYREMGHFNTGVPFIKNEESRVSITNTRHFVTVAFMPINADVDLSVFSPETALGIDAEHSNRRQVLNVRDKFLNETETALIDADDLKKHILAWTAKEAVLKALLVPPGYDYRNDITILSLPEPKPIDSLLKTGKFVTGKAKAVYNYVTGNYPDDKNEFVFTLLSYESDGVNVTVAYIEK